MIFIALGLMTIGLAITGICLYFYYGGAMSLKMGYYDWRMRQLVYKINNSVSLDERQLLGIKLNSISIAKDKYIAICPGANIIDAHYNEDLDEVILYRRGNLNG